MIIFRMRYTKHGKTGKTPPMLFPNHLIRLVDYFAQTSMSYFKAQNIACMGQDPMFQKGTGGAIVMKNIYTQKGYKVQCFFGLEINFFLGWK